MGTKVREIASRKLLPRRVWRLACTRVLRQMSCAAWAAPLSLSSMTVPRPTSESEPATLQRGIVDMNSGGAPPRGACFVNPHELGHWFLSLVPVERKQGLPKGFLCLIHLNVCRQSASRCLMTERVHFCESPLLYRCRLFRSSRRVSHIGMT